MQMGVRVGVGVSVKQELHEVAQAFSQRAQERRKDTTVEHRNRPCWPLPGDNGVMSFTNVLIVVWVALLIPSAARVVCFLGVLAAKLIASSHPIFCTLWMWVCHS